MKKRIISLVLAFVMVFSLTTVTFADQTISTEAKALASLGLLDGNTSEGVTSSYLAGDMNRFTAACMILKMMGAYDEAIKYQPTTNFPDAESLAWVEGRNVLGYLKAHPEFGFTGVPGGKFAPTQNIDQSSVLKVVLKCLGYEFGNDYTNWKDVPSFAQGKGLTVISGRYTIDGLTKNVFSALKTEPKNSNKTLAEELVAKKVIDRNLAASLGLIPESNLPLAVETVEFLNLRQVKVIFNKTVTADKVEKTGAYTINDKAPNHVVLLDDGRTVVLTTTYENRVENGSAKNEVEVLTSTGIGSKAEFDKLRAMDTEFPSIQEVKLTGPRTIKVFFSEPVKSESNPFTLKQGDKKVGLSSKIDFSGNDQIATLSTLAEVKDGAYTLSLISNSGKSIKDAAGYMVLAQDLDFDAVKDTNPATVEIIKVETDAQNSTSATKGKTTVTIGFSKDMKMNGDRISNLKARLGYNASSATSSDIKKIADKNNQYTVEFSGILSPGTHTMYLVSAGTSSSSQAKDSWGITFEDTTLEFDVDLDNERPYVESVVTEDENKIIVQFSEKVKGARFTVKDQDGKKVSVTTPSSSERTDKYTLTLSGTNSFKGGAYTIEIKDAVDLSIYENKMDAVTLSLDTTDKVKPTITSSVLLNNREVRVVFSEVMGEEVTEKDNWAVLSTGGATKLKIDRIDMSDNDKSVVIRFDGTFVPKKQNGTIYHSLQVVNAKDLAGNRIDGGLVANIGEGITDEAGRVKPTKVSLTGVNEVTLLYEDHIFENIDYDTYSVTINGQVFDHRDEFETVDVNIIDGGDTEVRLVVDGNNSTKYATTVKDLNNSPLLKVQARNNANIPEDQYNAKLNTEYIAEWNSNTSGSNENIVFDKAAPKFLGGTAEPNSREIFAKFSEPLYAASVQDGDFEVSGYDIKSVHTLTDGRVKITLSNDDDRLIAGETVTVYLVGNVEDIDGNEQTEHEEYDITVRTGMTDAVTFTGTGTIASQTESSLTVTTPNTATTVDIAVRLGSGQSVALDVTPGNVSLTSNVLTVSGLQPGTSKTFNINILETGRMTRPYAITVTSGAAALSGATIVGNPVVGTQLSVNPTYTVSPVSPNLTYQWFKTATNPATNPIALGTGATYTVVAGDIGYIYVVVTATGTATGTVTSPLTTEIGKVVTADVTFTVADGVKSALNSDTLTVEPANNIASVVITVNKTDLQGVGLSKNDLNVTRPNSSSNVITVGSLASGIERNFDITISEDGKTSRTYHVIVKPAKTTIESVAIPSGNLSIGQQLTVGKITYSGTTPETSALTYQWFRNTNNDATRGATNDTYTITNEDVDKYIYVTVTLADTANTAPDSKTSPQTAKIVANPTGNVDFTIPTLEGSSINVNQIDRTVTIKLPSTSQSVVVTATPESGKTVKFETTANATTIQGNAITVNFSRTGTFDPIKITATEEGKTPLEYSLNITVAQTLKEYLINDKTTSYTLYGDVALSDAITLIANKTIDLNGHKLTMDKALTPGNYTISVNETPTGAGTVTFTKDFAISGTVTDGKVIMTGSKNLFSFVSGVTLTNYELTTTAPYVLRKTTTPTP